MSTGVLEQYVGATPLWAGTNSRAVERDHLNRLPLAGCWQMGLFQQSVII